MNTQSTVNLYCQYVRVELALNLRYVNFDRCWHDAVYLTRAKQAHKRGIPYGECVEIARRAINDL